MSERGESARPELRALVDECVHCGFCLPACPTYSLWSREGDSPRGRIYLMRAAEDGEVELTPGLVGHFDRCLGCMACMPACPSGVRYDELVESMRERIESEYRRPFRERAARALLLRVVPRRGWLRALGVVHWIYRILGLAWIVRATGLIRRLPERLRAAEELAPSVALGELLARAPARRLPVGKPRLRAGLLVGCVQSVFFSRVNDAAAQVLVAEGCEVVAPRRQGCCGALALHSGRAADAAEHARQTIDSFEDARVDVVAITSAGCGSTMASYGRLLRDDPRYAERAAAFAAKCRDLSEVLASLEPRAARHPLPMRAAFLDACHLRHARGVSREPREALASIPGVELVELDDGGACCGSAGIYNVVEPGTARELGDLKAVRVLASGAEVLVTANPGCHLQLEAALRRAGGEVRVVSLAEVVDASIRGAGSV